METTYPINSILNVDFRRSGLSSFIAHDSITAEEVFLGNHVTIYPKVEIEEKCVILDGAVIGRLPISNGSTTHPIPKEFSCVKIGAGSIVGCNAVIYTGNQIGQKVLMGDLASLREGCVVGNNVILGRGVQVSYNCHIGDRSRIQDQAHLTGNMIIEEDVFIAMGLMTANDTDVYLSRFGLVEANLRGPVIRRFAVIGISAILLPGIEIGEGAMVAAGSVVTKDVAPWTLVAGIPARLIRSIPDDWREQIRLRDQKNFSHGN